MNATFIIHPKCELLASSFILDKAINSVKSSLKKNGNNDENTILGGLILDEDFKMAFLNKLRLLIFPECLDFVNLMGLIVVHHTLK